MGTGELQLVQRGGQDIFLTGIPQIDSINDLPTDDYRTYGDPRISHFKSVYRQHTPFGSEYVSLYFNVIPSLTPLQETKTSCKIDRVADLVHDTYLVYDLPAIFTNNQIPFAWTEEVGTKIIKEISIRLDGNTLDTQRGDFMKIYTDLTLPDDQKAKFLRCVGGEPYMLNTGQNLQDDITEQNIAIPARRLYIPLQFWFCKNSGLSIPLVALQNNELWIDVTFSPLNELIRIGYPLISPKRMFGDYENSELNILIRDYLLSLGYDYTNIFYYFTQGNWQPNTYLLANYIYLGDDERNIFSKKTHEYLITQTQFLLFQGLKLGNNFLDTTFFHPTKEILWVLTRDDLDLSNDWYNFTGLEDADSLKYYQSQLPYYGYSNFYEDELLYIKANFTNFLNSVKDQNVNKLPPQVLQTYFNNYYQIMQSAKPIFNNHDRMEEMEADFYQNLTVYKSHTGKGGQGIYVLPFALNPEAHQPSGSQNMSVLDNQQILIKIFDTFPVNQRFNCYMWAVSYNIFRIMGGIGATAFAS